MKKITEQTIRNLNIPKQEMYTWAEDTIKNKKDAILPPKISMKQDGHIFYNVMPCVLPKYNVSGVKIVNRYPQRKPSIQADLLLYDNSNGELISIMDATYITDMRTGAVAAHSIKLLAKNDFRPIGLIGLGAVTHATMDILLTIFPDREFDIKLYKYKDHAEKFIEKHQNNKNLKIEIFNTYDEVIKNTDVIVSGVTFIDGNFTSEENYKKGCLVVPIHTLGFQNCDTTFDKIYGDDYGHVCGFRYFNEFKSFAEVSEVVRKEKVGRENNTERILVYNIGIAIHDMYFATKIMQILNNKQT